MKQIEQYFHQSCGIVYHAVQGDESLVKVGLALFTILYKVLIPHKSAIIPIIPKLYQPLYLSFKSEKTPKCLTVYIKVIEHVVLFIMFYKVVLTLTSVDH